MKKYVLKHKAWLFITVLARSLGAILQVFVAIILQRIVDTAVSGNMNDFVKISLFLVFYFFIISVMDYSTGTSQAVYLKKTISDLREDIFKGIFSKDYKEFNSNNTADYISNLTNDINLVENNYIIPMLMMIGDIIIFLGTVIVLLSINVWITLTLFITAGFMLIVPGTLSKPMKNTQNKLSSKLSDFTTNIKEMFLGYEVIKSHNVEKNTINEFREKNLELEKYKFKSNHIQAITGSISVFLAIFCQTAGLIVAGFFLIKGKLTVGSLVAIIQLGTGINGPIMWITQKITQIKGMSGVNEKLIAITRLKGEDFKDLGELSVFSDKIEINNLEFSYKEGNNILNGINYTFEKNKKYAIVGESGCGKSTLIKLMLGYYKGYEGNITIDSKEEKILNLKV